MLRRAAIIIVILAIAGAALGWYLSAPRPLSAAELPAHEPDLANGERIFYIGGCSSCHATPGAKGEEKLVLAGGLELDTDFGIFRVPNISPDPETGIGGWSMLDFVNAVMEGVSPDDQHYYPSFPYASYIRMRVEDVIDLKGFMDTLPAVSNEVEGNDLHFPFNIRRAIGFWKLLFLSPDPVLTFENPDETLLLGQYLSEGPGHCGECHTSRNLLGGMKYDLWYAGAPNPDGRGIIPNITPENLHWSESEIVDTFKTGFTPDFDTMGGSMAAVQENLSHLSDEDLLAIATYLKAVPPLPNAVTRASHGG